MSDQTFEIGLVGAGAISAGAYTGGVIDFIVYALDQWYESKANGDNASPPHDVKISVFSGASAGAITAALAAGYLGSEQPSIKNDKEGLSNNGKNKLFDSWVERIDISSLLDSRDLADENSLVQSLLDSSILSEIADSGLNVKPREKRRPYVAENFELLMTITNLRGVPYSFPVLGSAQSASYDMSLHADYVHFRINDSGNGSLADRYTMSWSNFGNSSEIMEKLKLSALASGAFPIGLAPRNLSHVIPGNGQADWYSLREWPVPTPHSEPHQCVTPKSIPASWVTVKPDYQFDFQCVDGGVMNNEPLELARRILSGSFIARNPRKGEEANKAVLLIDPFPNTSSFNTDYVPASDLLKTALSLFSALKNQARFKADELVLAAQEDVYSRFMIAPSRDGADYPIACGALDGFGGFLKRDFRSHDYFLGRRNAQKFLRHHFVLPEKNPLFDNWTADMKDNYCIKDDSGKPQKKNDQLLLPIIPLIDKANDECYQAKWPQFTSEDLKLFEERIEDRVDIVTERLVSQYFKSNNPFVRVVAKLVMSRKKKDIVNYVQDKITADLKKMQLM